MLELEWSANSPDCSSFNKVYILMKFRTSQRNFKTNQSLIQQIEEIKERFCNRYTQNLLKIRYKKQRLSLSTAETEYLTNFIPKFLIGHKIAHKRN